MRKRAATDANQTEIVTALRQCGCSVSILASVGGGVPDLAAGRHGVNFFLEVKDGAKPPSKRELTDDQKRWHEGWHGQVAVVSNVDEALRAVGVAHD